VSLTIVYDTSNLCFYPHVVFEPMQGGGNPLRSRCLRRRAPLVWRSRECLPDNAFGHRNSAVSSVGDMHSVGSCRDGPRCRRCCRFWFISFPLCTLFRAYSLCESKTTTSHSVVTFALFYHLFFPPYFFLLQPCSCDPHPGNLLRTTDGKLCVLDWGMTLQVPPDLQYALLEFIAHVNSEGV